MKTGTRHEVQRPAHRPARYLAPGSLEDALTALADLGSRARPIAGGTDLLVELDRGGHRGVDTLVDLSVLPDLDRIDPDDAAGVLHIGALATHGDLVASVEVRRRALPLAQACREIGSPQLRNRATVAGNIATASPANDTISALVALGASVRLRSIGRERVVPVDEFVTGFRSTAIAPGELIVGMDLPTLGDWPDGSSRRGVFAKIGNRRAQAISVVHAAMVVETDPTGSLVEVCIALGSVAATIVTVPVDDLVGRPLDEDTIRSAAQAAMATVTPIDDVRATAAYRRQVVGVVVQRGLTALAQRREAASWPSASPPLLRTDDRSGAAGSQPEPSGRVLSASDTITVEVDGHQCSGEDAAGTTLLDWLRSNGHEGAKEGCAEGECGACTVRLDGAAVMACLVPAARADARTVSTVRGLADPAGLAPIQQAFVDTTAVQCGYCIPGFLMAAATLLDEVPVPDDEQIAAGLSGNLCRCTGYYRIADAVRQASVVAVEVDR